MNLESILYTIFSVLLSQLPFFIVCFTGIGFGIYNYKKSKIPSLSAIFGCLILILTTLVSPAKIFLNQYLYSDGFDAKTIGYISLGASIVFSIFFAGGIGLILTAVWKDRKPDSVQ
jgi:hypothetical protein